LFYFRYIDQYRAVSSQLGGPAVDLKDAIDKSGLTLFNSGDDHDVANSEMMYLKQGEHLMKKGVCGPALIYLNQALTINPDSKVKERKKELVSSCNVLKSQNPKRNNCGSCYMYHIGT
jgi:hypothetical protein